MTIGAGDRAGICGFLNRSVDTEKTIPLPPILGGAARA